MKVRLSRNAFAVMLANCIEVYKKEAFGLLVGRKSGGDIYVSNAVPCQAVHSSFNEVKAIGNRTEYLEDALTDILGSSTKVIGDYHSHPALGNITPPLIPSDTDWGDMYGEGRQVYLIIAVNNNKRRVAWHNCRDGRLAGTFNNHKFDITAYGLNERTDYYEKSRVTLPPTIRRKLK